MRTSRIDRAGEGILESGKADSETNHVYRVQAQAALRETLLLVYLRTLPVAQTKRTVLKLKNKQWKMSRRK
jgi:hypothetical protein